MLIHLMNVVAAGRTIDLNQFALRPTDHACLVYASHRSSHTLPSSHASPDQRCRFHIQQAPCRPLDIDTQVSRPHIRDRHI